MEEETDPAHPMCPARPEIFVGAALRGRPSSPNMSRKFKEPSNDEGVARSATPTGLQWYQDIR
jgi:hypothetical protein